jgi:aminoglycoside phosphotransferase (APT) family kinase protein
MADSPVAERSLDESGVRGLLRDAAPELADLPLRLVAEGWDNAIWRLGDELAVRLPRRALSAPLIAHEQRALPDLGRGLARVGLRAPVPLIAGQPTDGFPWPWSIVPWIEGTPVLGVSRAENGRWAATLAAGLLELHRAAPDDAPPNPFRGGALAARDAAMTERLSHTAAGTALRQAWEAGLRTPPSRERVWLHGDLHPGNMLVRDGGLAALIDFGDVTAGDPAYDLAVMWLVFDEAGRLGFRAATGGRYDEDTWIRARAWAAYLALVFLTRSDDRPDYLELGVRTETELSASAEH